MAWRDRLRRTFQTLGLPTVGRLGIPWTVQTGPGTAVSTQRPMGTDITGGPEIAISDIRQGLFPTAPIPRYNPDQLAQRHTLRIYDRVRLDEQVKACLALKTAAVVGPGWTLDPGDDSTAANDLATALEKELRQPEVQFNARIAELLTIAQAYGFAVHEKIFSDDDLSLIGLKGRAPHGFNFRLDPYGNIISIMQMQTTGWIEMPMAKFVHFVNRGEFDNPYGRSDLREAYRPYFQKETWLQAMVLWGQKLADQPVYATVPPNTSQQRMTQILDVLKRLQPNTALVLPEGSEVNLIAGNAAQVRAVFVEAWDRLDLAIARAILVPDRIGFAGGATGGGSYSLSQTQMGAFFFVLGQLGDALMHVIQGELIEQLVQFRFPSMAAPMFKLLPMSDEQAIRTATLFLEAVQSGSALSDVHDENQIRRVCGFPEVEETPDQLRAAIIQQKQQQQQMAVAGQQAALQAAQNPQQQPGAGGKQQLDAGNTKPPGNQFTPPKVNPASSQPPKAQGPPIPPRNISGRSGMGYVETFVASTPPSVFWRNLTPPEKRANMDEQRSLFDDNTVRFAEQLARGSAAIVRALADKAHRQWPMTARQIRMLPVPVRQNAAFRTLVQETLSRVYVDAHRSATKALPQPEKYAQARAGLIGRKAQSYWKQYAFHVTGLLTDDILAAGKQVLFNALRGDEMSRDVRAELTQALGDYLPKVDTAGKTVNVPARIETIARTNLATAINEGRWAAFTDPDVQQFVDGLQYSAVLDDRTRETHAAWDGVMRPVDDPVWEENSPPNGFNCRCVLVPIVAGDDTPMTDDAELPGESARDEDF